MQGNELIMKRSEMKRTHAWRHLKDLTLKRWLDIRVSPH